MVKDICKKRIMVIITCEQYENMKKIMKRRGIVSISEFMRQAVQSYIDVWGGR